VRDFLLLCGLGLELVGIWLILLIGLRLKRFELIGVGVLNVGG
jgi:hypothetical protein